MRKIYGIGETVYDIIFHDNQPQKAVPGGSTFNSLISLGRCGLHPTMVTETGDDQVGRLIVSFMQANDVDTRHVTVNPGTKTHISLAFLDANNDAHYQFYKDHASASVRPAFPEFHPDDIVLFGSFFAVNPVIRTYTREFLQRAHDAGCILYYDVNFRAAHRADLPVVIDNIRENMRLATIVRGSSEDFECLYGQRDPDTIYRQHIAPLCPNFICTAGADGIRTFFCSNHQAVNDAAQNDAAQNDARDVESNDAHTSASSDILCQSFDVLPISTVSTIGAGDNFNAGIIFSLLQNGVLRDQLAAPTPQLIEQMVASGQRFAAEVCQSLDNYVSLTFSRLQMLEAAFKKRLFLFDLDGVIIDTESQYEEFWGAIGREFMPNIPDFATRIKGSTLIAIHDTYFQEPKIRVEVDRRLDAFEATMHYRIFPEGLAIVEAARQRGIPCAIVTSSNQMKMDLLARQQPHLTSLFDYVFTAEDAGRSKPFPDCYLNAMTHFGAPPEDTVVFEDSVNGLKAARQSGALVVGLATTHPADIVRQYADITLL